MTDEHAFLLMPLASLPADPAAAFTLLMDVYELGLRRCMLHDDVLDLIARSLIALIAETPLESFNFRVTAFAAMLGQAAGLEHLARAFIMVGHLRVYAHVRGRHEFIRALDDLECLINVTMSARSPATDSGVT